MRRLLQALFLTMIVRQWQLTVTGGYADLFLVGVVINTTSSMDPFLSLPLISALGQRKAKTGKASFFIHVRLQCQSAKFPLSNEKQTSGGTAFCDKTGFTRDPIKDTEDVFSLVKQAEEKAPYPVRAVRAFAFSKEPTLTRICRPTSPSQSTL